ncbi:HelD family protein [Micromonospora sp. NPDC050417]|uniref:HelD family protein n=1 Tax=Micromonospora sp. NPDC050417 TaxID=3364280 RepID=UPI00379F26BB
MHSRSTEIAAEQAYFDTTAKHRDRKIGELSGLVRAAANSGAAAHLHRHAEAARQAIGTTEDAVAFGRVDDETGETLYLGRHLIRDDNAEVLVVNWQAPAVARYFEASHQEPLGLRRRRTFDCTGNTIREFTEVIFAEIAETVDRHLLAELERGRTGQMRDIVATIQAAQFALIRAPREQLLVIEGGPGSGKTAVALHRVSWLLFTHAETLDAADVLIVGPHPTFMRYIRTVLPGLGDAEVELRDIGRLAPTVARGRVEPAEVSRIKGEVRMAALLARALEGRIGVPEPAERLLVDGRFVTVPGAEVAEALDHARAAELPYLGRRQLFRDRLGQIVADRTGGAPRAGGSALANLVERLWPQQTAPAFLRDLLGSRSRLHAAAGTDFTAEELAHLHRRSADRLSQELWSAADLALLDELDHLVNGAGRRYGHVVVDEAQDLSPMQLRAVGRRSANGSFTVVGDIAQSTGAWARDSWDEVTRHLPTPHPVTVTALRYGYRVPRPAYALAARLLPVAAPGVTAPEVVRDGPEPSTHRVGLTERPGRVVTVALAHAAAGRFVGIVCPPRCRREVEAALAENGVEWHSADRGELGGSINLVSPQEAKGLEFDAVVVVEPAEIVASDERGHRLLYVALTRTTGHLDVVCVGDPLPLTAPTRPGRGDDDRPNGLTAREVRRIAEYIAGQLRGAAPEPHWDEVLAEVTQLLRPE